MAEGAIRLIRVDHLTRTPWKNGGGSTAEIAVSPDGAGYDDFDWRISMADVDRDGAFSTFAGVDRTLVLLRGDGLVLEVDGRSHRLDRPSAMVAFSGDAATSAALTGGPVRDFNVMTRRGRWSHRVDHVAAGRIEIETTTLLLADATTCSVSTGRETYRLNPLDALLTRSHDRLVIDARLLSVQFFPAV